MSKLKPFIEWDSSGRANERLYTFRECSDKNNPMRGHDSYGSITWQCTECRGYGSHQKVTIVKFARRPEFDAPTPENPRIPLTGEMLYTAFRTAWNPKAVKRGHAAGLPRWKDLKPWVSGIWNKAANQLNKEGI